MDMQIEVARPREDLLSATDLHAEIRGCQCLGSAHKDEPAYPGVDPDVWVRVGRADRHLVNLVEVEIRDRRSRWAAVDRYLEEDRCIALRRARLRVDRDLSGSRAGILGAGRA